MKNSTSSGTMTAPARFLPRVALVALFAFLLVAADAVAQGGGTPPRRGGGQAQASPPPPPPPPPKQPSTSQEDPRIRQVLRQVEPKLLSYATEEAKSILQPVAAASDADVLIAKGRIFAQEKKYGEAIQTLRRACEMEPDSPAAWAYLGETQKYANQESEARASFMEAAKRAQQRVAADPADAEAWYHLGMARRELDQYGAALESLAKARQLAPNDPMPLVQIGHVHYEQEKYQPAVDVLSQAIEMNSGVAYAYFYRGLAASKVGRKDLLIADLKRFLTLAPGAPEAPLAARLVQSTRR